MIMFKYKREALVPKLTQKRSKTVLGDNTYQEDYCLAMHLGILFLKVLLTTFSIGSPLPDLKRTEGFQGPMRGNLHQPWLTQARQSDGDDYEEFQALPEYTESVSDIYTRGLDHIISQKHYSICRLKRRIRGLNTLEHEYRPAYFEEVLCVSESEAYDPANEICSSLGFSCVQLNKTLHLTRRRYSSECWETQTMVVSAGCECMWPAHRLGGAPPHSRHEV